MDVSKLGLQNSYAAANKMTAKKNEGILRETKTTLGDKRDINESGVEISISNEGRTRQKQPKLTVDESILEGMSIDEIKAAINGDISRERLAEFTDPSLKVPINEGLLILRDDTAQEIYRKELTNVYWYSGSEMNTSDKFSSLASKYMELRKGIEEKYSGEELDEHLKWLDESYENTVDVAAKLTAFNATAKARLYEIRVKVNNHLVEHKQKHGHSFGIPVKGKIEYDEDAFKKAIKTLDQNVFNSIKNYGALAKQYMLDGNTAPVTEEDKNSFNAYMSQNTDSSKGYYSLDDMDMLNDIMNSNASSSTDALYSALEKLQNSGLSNDVRAALIRATTHGDRMFDILPKGYEEREKALYEAMLKWEKA